VVTTVGCDLRFDISDFFCDSRTCTYKVAT
jgi:hypothetical protein